MLESYFWCSEIVGIWIGRLGIGQQNHRVKISLKRSPASGLLADTWDLPLARVGAISGAWRCVRRPLTKLLIWVWLLLPEEASASVSFFTPPTKSSFNAYNYRVGEKPRSFKTKRIPSVIARETFLQKVAMILIWWYHVEVCYYIN